MTETSREQKGAGLWLWWVAAGAIGWGVGAPIGVALGTPGYIIENGFMMIAIGGVLTGVLQWLGIRRNFSASGWWAPSWLIGAVVFAAIVFAGLNAGPGAKWITDATWIVGAGLFAPVAAFVQWRKVLRYHMSKGAVIWVGASLVGFFAAGVVSALVTMPFGLTGRDGGMDAVIVWFVLGAAYGGLTGGVLRWLLRRSASPSGVDGLASAALH